MFALPSRVGYGRYVRDFKQLQPPLERGCRAYSPTEEVEALPILVLPNDLPNLFLLSINDFIGPLTLVRACDMPAPRQNFS